MSDPQREGLEDLSHRLHAMSEQATDPRQRPFQGAPLPIGPASGGRTAHTYGAFEDVRVSPPPPPPPGNTPNPPPPNPFSTHYSPQPAAYPQGSPFAPPATATPVTTPVDPYTDIASVSPYPPTPVSAPTPAPIPNLTNGHPFASDSGSITDPAANPSSQSQAPASLTAQAPDDPNSPKSGLQRAINAVRAALPLVQRLLPLLDGNFVTTLSNLVGQQPTHHPQPPQQVNVNLEPVERGLTELRNSQRDLRNQVQEQVTSLKRVEDHLERVREATDRNTLEQQELLEDLRSVGSRVSLFAIIGLVLLAISMGLNIYFLVQLQHILR